MKPQGMYWKQKVRWVVVCWIVMAGIIPARHVSLAQGPGQASASQLHTITGDFVTTNPIYPLIGAEIGIVLYDLSGLILGDYNFVPPPTSQVPGTLEGNITQGTYAITLPDEPQATRLDFDRDPATPPAVQVFAAATYIEYLGEPGVVDRGESMFNLSARIEPMSYHIVGGHVIVWTPSAGALFPGGLGADGAAFTADDPLIELPAGWSAVSLETEPFTIIQAETVDFPVIESLGALNDYSGLSYDAAWNKLYQRTQETYPFTADKQLDWALIYNEITPLVKAATSDLEFHLAIARFGALIPDTHIGYTSLPVLQAFLLGGVGISRLVMTDDGEIVMLDMVDGLPAAEAGIQNGDVLVAVDGVPARQALDETPLLLSSASTPHGRRYWQASTMLQGPVDTPVTLTWQRRDGSQQTARLVRVPDVSALLAALGAANMALPVIEGKMLDSGLGYISVRGFAQDVSSANRQFSQTLDSLIAAGAKGIILDVRNNSGGLVDLSMAIAGHFFPDYRRLFDLYYADGQGHFAYRGYIEILANGQYYDGPVALLVNEMTGSAGDLFVYAMHTDQRALVLGHTPTGGFTGEVSDGQYTLPGNLMMQVPTGRIVDPDTGLTLLEGTGVAPDIRVPLTLASLLSPEDEVLQAAEAALLAR